MLSIMSCRTAESAVEGIGRRPCFLFAKAKADKESRLRSRAVMTQGFDHGCGQGCLRHTHTHTHTETYGNKQLPVLSCAGVSVSKPGETHERKLRGGSLLLGENILSL